MANAVAAVVEAGLLRELGFSDDAQTALLDRNQQHQQGICWPRSRST